MYQTIALLLLMTFAFKIMVIDGAWMVSAMAGEEYVHINPFCKSKNGSGTTDQTSIHKFADNQIISVDGICSSQLFLDEKIEQIYIYPTVTRSKSFRTIPAYEVYQDTHYPPPQV